jgi:hypothetical protein
MAPNLQIVLTEAGPISVNWASPDSFRVAMDNALPPGGQVRYRVRGDLFMPEPGQFIDIDPDGADTLSILPQSTSALIDDVVQVAAELAAGRPMQRDSFRDDREILRQTIMSAVTRVFDLAADQAERSVMEPAMPEQDEGGPAYRM